jgi:hypothetical protein
VLHGDDCTLQGVPCALLKVARQLRGL